MYTRAYVKRADKDSCDLHYIDHGGVGFDMNIHELKEILPEIRNVGSYSLRQRPSSLNYSFTF